MLRRGVFLSLICLFVVAAIRSPAAEESATGEREVENLAAFARVYGYVRFFHPSDQAASVDWDKVAVLGAQMVRGAVDHGTLRAALLRVFQPMAPRIRLADTRISATAAETSAFPTAGERTDATQATGLVLTFWQYIGIKLTDQPGPYRQQRMITGKGQGGQAITPPAGLENLFRPGEFAATAAEIRTRWPLFTKTIAQGLVLHLPLALPVNADGKTTDEQSTEFKELKAQLAGIDLKAITPTDWRLRVAGVVTVWNVFQHFHPYLDGIGVKWDEALESALRRALRDQNADDYYATLSELVAKSQDGHGYVYGRPAGMGGIPIRVAMVEERLIVTGVGDGAPFRKGDIVERIDGVPAIDVLRERERYASGSPHLRRFRALNQFGEGPLGSVARVEVVRNGAEQKVEFMRTPDRRGYFFNPISEFEFPAFAEVRPGIFYVNLSSLDVPAFEEKLPWLAGARGVIFDWRWDGRNTGGKQTRRLQPHADIIPHLIDKSTQASPMLIPQVTMPDRVGWTYSESSWPVQPKTPRFKGRIVSINEPSVVSYGETCMAMIADYHLAMLVGAPTAGCNGNANFIPLPGGFRVMWTGMDVRKHDRSPFYTIGFVPDFPVARTIRTVKEGRDEYLEKAIEVIEQSAKPTRP